MSQIINPRKYPLRTCRYFDECLMCKKRIESGSKYYDGGYGRRFHKECVDAGGIATKERP